MKWGKRGTREKEREIDSDIETRRERLKKRETDRH